MFIFVLLIIVNYLCTVLHIYFKLYKYATVDGNNTTKSWELEPYMCICKFLFSFYLRVNITLFFTVRLCELLVTDGVMNFFEPHCFWTCMSENVPLFHGDKCSWNTTNKQRKWKPSLGRSETIGNSGSTHTVTAAASDQNQPTNSLNHHRIFKCNIPVDGKGLFVSGLIYYKGQ